MLERKIVIVSDDWATTDLWSQNVKGNRVGVDLVDFGATVSWLDALHRYDLAVVDINDCDDAGADVCRSLREASDIPVLVLTYNRDERTHLKFYGIGVDECVVKPIGIPLLLSKLKAWLFRVSLQNSDGSQYQSYGRTLESELRGVT